MLIELFGRNFRCFRDEFRLSMLATDIEPDGTRGVIEVEVEGEDKPLRLLRSVAIYGPNASGKSSVLWAAAALNHMIRTSATTASDDPILPYEPFLLNDASATGPVKLGLRAVVDRREYDYSVAFDDTEVIEERLVRLTREREEVLFDRNEKRVEGAWTEDRQFGLIEEGFRPNALLLSLADSLAPSLTQGLAVTLRNLLIARFTVSGTVTSSDVAELAHNDDAGFGRWLTTWLRQADFGVDRYDVNPTPLPADTESLTRPPKRRTSPKYKLSLFHRGRDGSVEFPSELESWGTRRLIELSPIFYDLMHGNGFRALFIDELDASLHPQLLDGLLREFNECPQERVYGQLIFATHETSLLDHEAKDAVLRRDQIYLTEKDADGAARLYSVAEFKERNNLNLRRRYLQGRYGALPSLGSFGD